jgi:hypothetical protein
LPFETGQLNATTGNDDINILGFTTQQHITHVPSDNKSLSITAVTMSDTALNTGWSSTNFMERGMVILSPGFQYRIPTEKKEEQYIDEP